MQVSVDGTMQNTNCAVSDYLIELCVMVCADELVLILQ